MPSADVRETPCAFQGTEMPTVVGALYSHSVHPVRIYDSKVHDTAMPPGRLECTASNGKMKSLSESLALNRLTILSPRSLLDHSAS